MPACKACGSWFVKIKPREELCDKCECALCRLSGYVAPVRHGKWVPLGQRTYGGGRSYTHYCNRCGQHGYDDYVLCPNCGADMRGRRDE